MAQVECIWAAETDFGSHTDHKLSSAAVLDRPRRTLNRFGRCSLVDRSFGHIDTRATRVSSSNLNTQLRPART